MVRVTGHVDKLESDHADFDALLKARQRKQNGPRARRIVRVSMSQTLDPHPAALKCQRSVPGRRLHLRGGGGMGVPARPWAVAAVVASPRRRPSIPSATAASTTTWKTKRKRGARFLTSNNSSSSSNDNSSPNQNNKSQGNRSGGGGEEEEYNDYYDLEAGGPEDMLKWREELDDPNAAPRAPPSPAIRPTTGKKLKAARGGGSGTEDGHFPLTRLAEHGRRASGGAGAAGRAAGAGPAASPRERAARRLGRVRRCTELLGSVERRACRSTPVPPSTKRPASCSLVRTTTARQGFN